MKTSTPEESPITLDRRPRGATPHGSRAASRLRALAALAILCAAAAVAISACSAKQQPPPDPGDSGEPGDTGEPVVASGVNATVIVAKCPDAKHMKVRVAQDAINKLVGPCASVPGGSAHFSATLQPNGSIVLASPEGDPAEGVVPTCVLKNRLQHHVRLKSPCTLDVQLDERKVTVDRDGGAPDGEAPAAK